MNYFEAIWKSIILGTVQGLTEFLPVSSSGHLSLLQRVLNYSIGGGGMMFVNVMLHLGTLFAVVWVFRRDILALFKKPFKTLLMLIVATIPAGVVGLLFNSEIDELFSGELGLGLLALCFSFTALLLLITEYVARRRKQFEPLNWQHSLTMGCMQAIALFPGISRSGSTVFAGTVSGAKREDVAKFSFLMSIPIILGSVAVEIKDIVFPEEGVTVAMAAPEIVGMIFGVLFAAVSGFFAVKVMLKVINRANYKWFSLYLVLLAVCCLSLDVAGVL